MRRDGLPQRGGQAIDAHDVVCGDRAHEFRREFIDELTRPVDSLRVIIEELVAADDEPVGERNKDTHAGLRPPLGAYGDERGAPPRSDLMVM